ncbi:hypothetical protein yc1106_06399 [Curvularia clavata]|uniref:Uncharacterized protein n=1 Tax=Curvularia clavata TaxID=95742 RepID=A0A9Q8ZBF3_CURCL|nr:hypothetical protein yc1106_06399 [Curvularia clavata]
MAMATSRTPTCPLFPRIDALPRPLRVERERAVSQAVLRPVSTDSLSPPQRKYPPDTSDRPAPLSVRPSTANLRSSPSLSIGFTSSESAPPLPFGFPSPRSTLRVSNSNSPALASYTSSLYDDDKFDDEQTDKEDEGDSTWESRVADIYERVIGLERPEQLDQVIEELQGLKALYCNTPTPSPKKRS